MQRGDQIYVRRGPWFSHHGIFCGDDTVIHYAGPRRGVRIVARTSLEEFALGGTVRVRRHRRGFDPEATVRSAESMLGFSGYHLLRYNCEHLAAWCRTGRARSSQVRRYAIAAQGTASIAIVGTPQLPLLLTPIVGVGVYALTRPRHL